MVAIACGCNKARGASGGVSNSGTYRVMVGGRQVYESSSKDAADAVASRFATAEILNPEQFSPTN